MRPIRLVISAFGPYKDRVEIDFNKLGENGIFLVTGDTGSGKTTIFDAISFALFGEASGSKRETNGFRSDFATDDIETFVELEFVHKGDIYKLRRVPRYMRKKKRRDGYTAVGGDASLIYLGLVVTGEKNVTDECVKILGMNVSQFKQVSMIAQGEFLDLLLSKTKDRATIFRHIFDTGIYKAISDKLKDKYLNKKREYEDIATYKKGYVNSVELEVDLSGDESTDEVLALLDKELKYDMEVEFSLEKEKNDLFKQSSKIVEVISKGKVINNSILELSIAKDKLGYLLEQEEDFKSRENLVKRNKDIWDSVMPKYFELDNLSKDLESKKNQLNNNKNEYENVSREYDKVLVSYIEINDKLKKIQEYNRLIDDNKKKLLLLEEIDKKLKELDILGKKLCYCKLEKKRELLNKVDKCCEYEVQLGDLRKNIIKKKEEYIRSNELYSKHYDMFLSAQAGILASGLQEGEACPVCGSINHPSLAKLVDDVLTKEELDREKITLEDKYQSLESLRLELLDKEKEYELLRMEVADYDKNTLIKEIDELEEECRGIEIEDDVDVNDLERKIQQLEISIQDKHIGLCDDDSKDKLNILIEDYKKSADDLDNEVANIRRDYDDLLKKKASIYSLVEVLNNDVVKLDKRVVLAREEYVQCYRELGYSNEDEYVSVRLDKEEVFKLEHEVNKYRDEVVRVKANIDSLEKIINGREMVNLEIYEEELKLVNGKLDSINLSLKKINSKISNNKKIYNSLVNVAERMTKLEREVMIYKDLSDTANGSIAGKSKLEFEQYVQASYFDRVLLSANKRFEFMTDERYHLVRKEEASKVSDKLGLELEVMDYYTGKRRDVKSLSGGESFKAALSLALGMSDTIQEFSGGIVVDAMFIDEGFGSLDDESLDQAMNAIMMLSHDNKMIGIISHVNELKARIDKKIVVKKSSSGSSVSLVV